jgi:hypothetical protein
MTTAIVQLPAPSRRRIYPAAVRYDDGTVRYAAYNAATGSLWPGLFGTAADAFRTAVRETDLGLRTAGLYPVPHGAQRNACIAVAGRASFWFDCLVSDNSIVNPWPDAHVVHRGLPEWYEASAPDRAAASRRAS